MTILAAILAKDLNWGIGLNNKLPWPNHSEDMKRFKSITLGCCVIMGRKTHESMGRLLPGRKNIIITRNLEYKVDGATIVHSLEDAIAACDTPKSFIIGGAEIYLASQSLIEELYTTTINENFDHDTSLKWKFVLDDFEEISIEDFGPDEKNPIMLTFKKYTRRK